MLFPNTEPGNPYAVANANDLELKARVILGWDVGQAEPLTLDEREYMRDDAYRCSPSYPNEEAPAEDAALCRWWMAAMKDYVDCL